MVLKSRYTCTVPNCSLPTWVFGSPSRDLSSKPIFISAEQPDTEHLSFASYRSWSARFAAGLVNTGVEKGNRIVLIAANSVAFPVAFMGGVMAGGVVSTFSPTSPASFLAGQLRDLEPSIVLVSETNLDTVQEALGQASLQKSPTVFLFRPKALFTQDDGSRITDSGLRSWAELLASEKDGAAFDWRMHCNETAPQDQLAAINFTSGTTGASKGNMVSHRNYVANCAQYVAMIELDPIERDHPELLRSIGYMPMFYVLGQTQFVCIYPKRGIRVIVMERPELKPLVKNVEAFGVTDVIMTPATVISWAKTPSLHHYNLESIRSVPVGGAPLVRKMCEDFESLLPRKDVRIKQGWGATEVTCVVTLVHPLDKSGTTSVGELLANCEGKVINLDDSSGRLELGAGEIGEMYVRAPNVSQGYLKKPEMTKANFSPDGWCKTGDVGYYDEKGYWYVLDRVSELISRRGEQVVPSKLEYTLLEMDAVLDATVFGVEENSIAQLYACIVLDSTKAPYSTQGVLELYNAGAKPAEQIERVVAQDALPKLPGGKNFRRKARELFQSMRSKATENA